MASITEGRIAIPYYGFMKAAAFALSLPLIFLSLPASAGHEPVTIALGLGPKDAAAPLAKLLEKNLALSKCFVLRKAVTPPKGSYPWPDNQWKVWQKQTDARVAFVGTATKAGTTSIEITCQAIDLKQGIESKVLSTSGSDLESISKDIVRFLRSRYPLRAVATPLKDDRFLLDVGSQDGVSVGTNFIVWRYPDSFKERLATFSVSKTNPWSSEAKMIRSPNEGKAPQLRAAAMLATEDPAEILTRP